MNIIYNDMKKELPTDQLHKLFVAVGWSAGTDTPDMIQNYSIPFINSNIARKSYIGNGKLVMEWRHFKRCKRNRED